MIVYCKIRPPLHDNTHWHCRVPRPSLCSLSCLEDLALASAVGLYLTIRNIWHPGGYRPGYLSAGVPLEKTQSNTSIRPLHCFQTMTRKMFGLYRSYRLGVGDVFGMVLLGLLVLAAIAIAVFTNTANVHPGMLGLVVVAFIIIMFALICG